MPFPWLHPDVPTEYRNAGAKANAMYEQEIRERAALLMRLGFSKDETRERIRENVRWDFERQPTPAHLSRASKIVDEVYSSRRSGGGGPPTL